MIYIKRILTICIIAFIGYISFALSDSALQVSAQEPSVGLVINGHPVNDLPIPPIIDRDRVLVPARAVFERLGATVEWREDTRTVHVQYHESNVVLTIEQNIIMVNGYPIEIPVPAQIIDGHTMIPAGAVSANLGFSVDFRNRSVFIDTQGYIPPPIIIDEGHNWNFLFESEYEDCAPVYEGEELPIVIPTIPANPVVLSNMRYDFQTGTLFVPKAAGFSLMNGMIHTNSYHRHRYEIALGVDATSHLPAGTLVIGDALLHSIDIVHGAQGTRIIFHGRQILAIDVSESANYYLLRVMCPRQRYSRIVIIDPGHGGERPGAVYYDVRAADLNLAVTRKLLQLIEADGFMKAYTTRNTDTTVPLAERATLSNNIGDLMLTIHHNAAYNRAIHGVETFYLECERDEFRTLTNQEFASIIQRNMLAQTNRHDRGIRSENFIVLRYTEAPSALVELGFMSHEQEFLTLINAEYQWRAAVGLYHALLEAFGMYVQRR